MGKILPSGFMYHGIRIIAICAAATFFIFLPYFPGEYDHMVVMISSMLQFASFVSLLLVPIGILWLVSEITQRRKVKNGAKNGIGFAIVTLVVLSLMVIIASFVAIGGIGNFRGSFILGISFPIIFIYLTISRIIPRMRQMRNTDIRKFSFIPFYLILIPIVVVIFRSAFINVAVNYSRSHAIAQSSVLIQDLEEYYSKNGQYPVSLQGLWKDYYPNVMGIERYYYEPNGDAYNVFFEQFSPDLFAREIVMYNKLDEHIIRSHPSFMFSLSPEEWEGYRGYFAEFDLPEQDWKYFLFD